MFFSCYMIFFCVDLKHKEKEMAANDFNVGSSLGSGYRGTDANLNAQQSLRQNASTNKASSGASFNTVAKTPGKAVKDPRLTDPDFFQRGLASRVIIMTNFEANKHEELEVY